jgi:glycosyltransferase involved in cell wall biosynthesis
MLLFLQTVDRPIFKPGYAGMQVTFYQRRPQGADFSIERVFTDVRRALPEGIEATVAVSRFPSRGLAGRIYNVIEAAFRQGNVNHITGDVHFLAYCLHRKRTLLTILDLVSVHRLDGWRRAVFLFFWYWLPIRRAAVVTVISEATKKDLLQHVKVDARRVRVVYCPVSSGFQPVAREWNVVKPVVLQVGTGANKNIERVARALQGISCHLRVIGELDGEQVRLLGQCGVEYSTASRISDAQMIEEYRRCDVLVFASTYEGFGLPIVEAQMTGRPVVTSNIMSMPEVGGDGACLVDPFDVSSIRSGMLKIINDHAYREELVRRGFDNAVRFQADAIAQEYAAIYRELWSSVRGRPRASAPDCADMA